METIEPTAFAAAAQPLLGMGRTLLGGPSKVAVMAQGSWSEPGQYVPTEAQSGGWRDAISKAWRIANPLTFLTPTVESTYLAMKEVRDGGGQALAAAAKSVTAAGEGVKRGTQAVTVIVLLLVLGYLFLMVSPFLPRPAAR